MKTSKQRQIDHDNSCFRKAQERQQRTFTLVEQDRSASKAILYWILLNWDTCPAAKLEDAFEDALAMRDSAIPKKAAD